MRLAADVHDAAVAGISHLPLVLAAALVEAVAGSRASTREGSSVASQLAASGWRDDAIGEGDVTMGTGIIVTNPGPVADRLRDVIAVLEGWLADLDRTAGPDADAIARRLRGARERLGSMPR